MLLMLIWNVGGELFFPLVPKTHSSPTECAFGTRLCVGIRDTPGQLVSSSKETSVLRGHQNWRAVRGVWGCWRGKGLLLRKARGAPGEGWDLVWPWSVQGIQPWGRGGGATRQRADAKATENELQGGLGPRVHVNPNRRQKLLLLCKQQDGFEPPLRLPPPNMVLLLGKESPLSSHSHS